MATPVPPGTLLDITRTVTRISAGSESGVDRVERAYARHVLETVDDPVFLARVLGGLALLGRAAAETILAADADDAVRADLLGLLARRQSPARRRVEAMVRRLADATVRRSRLAAALKGRFPDGCTYLNVGHTNLDAGHLAAVRQGGARRIAIMVHDLIPLDYPEFARAGSVAPFETKMRGACAAADLVIFNSAQTARSAGRWLARWGVAPETVVALLGVEPPLARPAAKPPDGPAEFVILGTIEPRKNHLLLLNIWRQFHDTLTEDEIPHLHIVGRRGWENENIVDQLERAPFMGRTVFEHGYLSDEEVAARIARARALLFPSFAEGFGLPLVETLALGVPAICSDLAVFRELAGENPAYLDPLDGPGWKAAILSLARRGPEEVPDTSGLLRLPGWPEHFAAVDRALAAAG